MLHNYNHIISVENLLLAWREFARGKKHKKNVQEFGLRLMDNILDLHADLKNQAYRHGGYEHFKISDPKPRDIHKASVRDRLVHHAVYRILYPYFHTKFIHSSYSCQLGKGTHKAIDRFKAFGYKVSRNHTKTCWVLKCDVRKFFASIDQTILLEMLQKYIPDQKVIGLLKEIVSSFHSAKPSVGLSLGNLTSQLLVNIYMNEFDQFIKHELKVKYYIRYADDFVIMGHDETWLESLAPKIDQFLQNKLKLNLHPDKVYVKTLASRVDFLGWVHFPDHRVLRTNTKHRMFNKLAGEPKPETIQSYLGLLSHGNTKKLQSLVQLNHVSQVAGIGGV